MVQTKIQKWGNSLGLRIPKSFADQVGVEAGSDVDLALEDGELIVRPARRPRYDLEQLLRRVSKSNIHRELDAGDPRGKEVW